MAIAYGERLLFARLDGDTLVLTVEGLTNGAHDAELPGLLRGSVPSGTPVVGNRVAGRSQPVGDVAGRRSPRQCEARSPGPHAEC